MSQPELDEETCRILVKRIATALRIARYEPGHYMDEAATARLTLGIPDPDEAMAAAVVQPYKQRPLIDRARRVIALAERDLGWQTIGEKTDLLLDNIPELRNSADARALVHELNREPKP